MRTITVTELKARVSRYLRLANQGSEVLIIARGQPVARLVGLTQAPKGKDAAHADQEKRERLVRAGSLRPGTGDLRSWLKLPPLELPALELGQALSMERGDRF